MLNVGQVGWRNISNPGKLEVLTDHMGRPVISTSNFDLGTPPGPGIEAGGTQKLTKAVSTMRKEGKKKLATKELFLRCRVILKPDIE